MSRFDLEAYVLDQAPDKIGRHEYLLRCPQCFKEKLSVNLEKNRWRCFLCEEYFVDSMGVKHAKRGAGGPFGLVKWLEGLDARGTIERISQYVTDALGSPYELPELGFSAGQEELPALCPTGLPSGCVAAHAELPYLKRRGISAEDIQTFGLGFVESGWVGNRLIFPVWERGECIYWQARAMWDEHEHVPCPFTKRDGTHDEDKFRKTLNPSRSRTVGGFETLYFGSGDVLLNLEQASRYPRVCITEGPTSAIRVGPSAVATFGKQLQPVQIARLIRAGVKAVDFMWDGPSKNEPFGAWENMIKAAGQLAPFMDVNLCFLPSGDPGDYTRPEIEAYRAHARPYSTGTTSLLLL